jgi:hypothetical protein
LRIREASWFVKRSSPRKGFAHSPSRRSCRSSRRSGYRLSRCRVVRAFIGRPGSPGAGDGPRRRRSRPSSSHASPSARSAARPQRRHRLPADARARVLDRRRRSPRRSGLSRAQRPSATERRQLRCRLELRPPNVSLHERPPRDHRARKHPSRGRSRARARGDRFLPHPQPLVAAVSSHRLGRNGARDARREGSCREGASGARPRRCEPRALLPQGHSATSAAFYAAAALILGRTLQRRPRQC